jgi:hypothetical protein
MAKFVLHYSSIQSTAPFSVSFEHPLSREIRKAVRGKNAGALQGFGTFQWTPAFQALCLLLLRVRAHAYETGATNDQPLLSGEQGSPAATLDYALSKQPAWLFDIFGADRRDRCFARKLFARTNPERKHGGPVYVSLKNSILTPTDILIVSNGIAVTEPATLRAMADRIEVLWSTFTKRRSSPHIEWREGGLQKMNECGPTEVAFREQLRRDLYREASTMLRAEDIFSRDGLQRSLANIHTHPAIASVINKQSSFVHEIELNLSSAARLGLGVDEAVIAKSLTRADPLRCSLTWTSTAALLIFLFLKKVKGYNIALDFQYQHAIELKRKLLRHEFTVLPDVCVLAIAPAADLIASRLRDEFSPHMLLPRISHGFIAPRTQHATPACIGITYEDFSTSLLTFDALQTQRPLSQKKFQIQHKEACESAQTLSTQPEGYGAVLCFPYYSLNTAFNNAELLAAPNTACAWQNVLFTHRALTADTQRLLHLNLAIRDAWLELLRRPDLIQSLVDLALADEQAVRAVWRFAGTQYMREFQPTA